MDEGIVEISSTAVEYIEPKIRTHFFYFSPLSIGRIRVDRDEAGVEVKVYHFHQHDVNDPIHQFAHRPNDSCARAWGDIVVASALHRTSDGRVILNLYVSPMQPTRINNTARMK